ncbi:pyruvate dehydrogenase (acetyl-transferring) E1 component subunit alpha, partial [Candidatus Woesearchaeota archaeon]|nr:pyruvate dehydrogenase (acetyl-transferring) E1 component subunit alpha [Candidatus Woesearchaeota archaeon]
MVIEDFDPLKGEMLQVLDTDGNLSSKYPPSLKDEEVITLYKAMVLSRQMDWKATALQRQGRLITYIPQAGQEAAAAASVFALKKEDWLVPAFRELAGYILRGASLEDLLIYLSGNEQGSKNTASLNMLPLSIPIGSQIPHAVGISWAAKLKKDPIASLVFFGDGASSEADFHEGLNFAGVFKTPTVFFCMNNQWAISTPRSVQTASRTIAQKALSYGFNGIQVDGNDIFAVHLATKEALENARKGIPTLIEAVTFRQGPHTTADDPKKYRT